MMSCSSDGLSGLEQVVPLANGRITEACHFLRRSATARWLRLRRISIPALKAEGKGETIRAESNNSRLQIPSIRFKDTNPAGSLQKREEERRGEQPHDWRKTMTVNRELWLFLCSRLGLLGLKINVLYSRFYLFLDAFGLFSLSEKGRSCGSDERRRSVT